MYIGLASDCMKLHVSDLRNANETRGSCHCMDEPLTEHAQSRVQHVENRLVKARASIGPLSQALTNEQSACCRLRHRVLLADDISRVRREMHTLCLCLSWNLIIARSREIILKFWPTLV
jgi:hypothetical protein